MWKGEMGELREGTVCVCVCVCAHAIFLTKCNDCFDGRLYACVRAFSCVCVCVLVWPSCGVRVVCVVCVCMCV